MSLTDEADVVVVGAGPAGWALAHACAGHGLDTVVVAPRPDAVWWPTYGLWAHQADALPAGSDVVAAGAVWAGERRLSDGYVVLDNASVLAACRRSGARLVRGTVVGVEDGTTVVLRGGGRVTGRVVVDASGRARVLSGGVPVGQRVEQTAYGVVVPSAAAEALVAPGEAVFMRWGETTGWPTFLYAVPLPDGRTLLEETSLARRPGLPLDELTRRLNRRLAAAGITGHHATSTRDEVAEAGDGLASAEDGAASSRDAAASGIRTAGSGTGLTSTEAGVTGTDAGVAGSEAGVAGAETGVVGSGTGVARTGTGVADADVGVAGAETGVADADAGVAGADAGVVGSEAGVVGSGTGVARTGIGVARTGAGIASVGDSGVSVERVRFPVDLPMSRGWGDVVAFGVAAGMMHPATGYSVGEVLATAPAVAAVIADELPRGAGRAVRGARAVVWSPAARAVRQLRVRGLRALLALPPERVPEFFDVFFALPPELRRAYLTGRDDLRGTTAAMAAVFGAAPWRLRHRLVTGVVR